MSASNYIGLNSFESYAHILLFLKLKISSYIRNVNSILYMIYVNCIFFNMHQLADMNK